MEIIKKRNNAIQETNVLKNNYFIHFIILSIFLIAVLLLIYKYYEKKNLNKNEN